MQTILSARSGVFVFVFVYSYMSLSCLALKGKRGWIELTIKVAFLVVPFPPQAKIRGKPLD